MLSSRMLSKEAGIKGGGILSFGHHNEAAWAGLDWLFSLDL